MKYMCTQTILILGVLTLALACSDDPTIIGPGHYIIIPGSATILSVNKAPLDENRCINDPGAVMFFFEPDDSTAIENYLFPNWSDTSYLTVADGKHPGRGWVMEESLTVGSTHPCDRYESHLGS